MRITDSLGDSNSVHSIHNNQMPSQLPFVLENLLFYECYCQHQ